MIELVQAIRSRTLVEFKYKGKKRRAEVYCLGVSKRDELLVRCYEVPSGGWKLFKVALIKDIEVLNQRFYLLRTGYNRNGDGSMVEVIENI